MITRRNRPERRRRRDQVEEVHGSADLINETDSEDADDEPRAKMSESKKFPDQLMETEDGEVVDLNADYSDDEIGSAPDDSGRTFQSFALTCSRKRGMKKQKEDMDMLSSDDEEDDEVDEPEATDEVVERLRKEKEEMENRYKELLQIEKERSEKMRQKLEKYFNLHKVRKFFI